jgi:hypothetical protein
VQLALRDPKPALHRKADMKRAAAGALAITAMADELPERFTR